jgi:putative membrane protein
MLLTRRETPVLIANLVYVPAFTVIALRNLNFEFVLYVGVILIVGAWVVWKQRSVRFNLPILWGLTIWGLLHMAGGNIRVGDDILYGLQLIPVVLRYDQLVHAFGFGMATLVCHHLLKPYLRDGIDRWRTLSILIVLMGSGLGAINEIIEFIAVKTLPETNVGGYDNTLWDLIFNLIGGLLAVAWLTLRRVRQAARSFARNC